MRGGAIEFLTKLVEDDILLEAIGHAIKADAAALEVSRAHDDLADRYGSLTERERETVAAVSDTGAVRLGAVPA